MNSRQGIVKKIQGTIFEILIGLSIIFRFLLRYDFGMRLFFLMIPKPLRQHPILKKTIHSAIFKDLEEKLPDPLTICNNNCK
jgi:hypothetical protein